MLSLTVEFYRLEPVKCTQDGEGNVISPATNEPFPYEAPNVCRNLPCSVDDGPWSSLRQGSTNEIFIIPAPQKLTFGAATLLAAACCIPAILSMVSMWNKILEINWKRHFGHRNINHDAVQTQRDEDEEIIEGTNGATVGKMKNVNDIIRQFLSVVQIPVFVGAVLAIMVIGELNFWSESVNYQTEPVTSIGQWGPIVGTVLAALGSLYVLWMNPQSQSQPQPGNTGGHLDSPNNRHDNVSRHGLNNQQTTGIPGEAHVDASPRNSQQSPSVHHLVHDSPVPCMTDSPEMVEVRRIMSTQSTSPDLHRYMSHDTNNGDDDEVRPTDAGGRRKVAQIFGDLGRYMGTPAPDLFDDSEFRRGRAMDFPEIPGEAVRNPDLEQIRSQYNQPHDSDEEVTLPALGRSRSRAESFVGVAVDYDAMGISTISRSASPSRVQSLSRSRSRPPQSPGIATRASTMPVACTPKSGSPPQSPVTDMRDTRPRRRETLEVPSPTRPHVTAWSNSHPTTTAQSGTSTDEASNSEPSPPTIVISPDPEAASSTSSRPPASSALDPALEPPKPDRDP